nr:type II secretion system F family protein [Flexivirga oryzae]
MAAAVVFAVLPLVWPTRGISGRAAVPAPAPVPACPGAAGRTEDVLSVAGALELMALALGSGVPLVVAVEQVAQRSGPVVAGHLRRVVAALRWGVEDAKAWEGLPEVWRPAARAVALAGMAGVPPAGLLTRAAADLRRAEQRRIEEATGRLSVLVVIPLGLCFLPAFALLTVVPVVAALAGDLLAGAA